MKRASLLGVCLGLALMVFALVGVTFAESWFSESNYAYFIGDVDSWDEEWAEGIVCVSPENSCFGDEPDVTVSFDNSQPGGHVWTGYSKSAIFYGSMVSISMVAFDYNGTDFYMSGTFKIRADIFVNALNITDVTAFVAELSIADIAIITTESNITDVAAFIADSTTAEITVFYVTEESSISQDFPTVMIDDVVVGDFDVVISYGVYDGDPLFTVMTKQNSGCVPGELYVTGSWTDFAVEIEGFGMLSGKVQEYHVNCDPENPTVARTDVNHNRKIDILDVAKVAHVYGSTIGSPLYDPNLDFNSDSIINIVDLAAVARNFGKTF